MIGTTVIFYILLIVYICSHITYGDYKPKWEEFITAFIMDRIGDGGYLGCPAAVLGNEIAFSAPDIAEEYAKILMELIDLFDDVLKSSGIPEEKSYALTKKAFCIYERHLLFYRLSKEVKELESLTDELIRLYKLEKAMISAYGEVLG